MSETQRYKISYETRSIALTALHAYEHTLNGWIDLEPDPKLVAHLDHEREKVRAAVRELGNQ